MGGIYVNGESKIRPGAYFSVTTGDERTVAKVKGIVAVLFKADGGPVVPKEIFSEAELKKLYGDNETVDAAIEAFAGGAKEVVAVRVGSGGTKAAAALKEQGGESAAAVTITAKYPGKRAFSVTVRDSIDAEKSRELIIYEGQQVFERFVFAKGDNESKALADAMFDSMYFDVEVNADGKVLADTAQTEFSAGTNPSTTTQDYSTALELLEMYDFDVIAVDTEDTDIHKLVVAYIDRIYEAGQLAMTVLAEKSSVLLKDRMAHAKAFNSEKVIYVVNPAVSKGAVKLDGYQTAARIAGMVACGESNISLTHTVVDGITELTDRLTPSQMEDAELSGCLVLSYSPTKKVWIDNAINTLVEPAANQDNGWKKIRRTKTRYELIRRVNEVVEISIGKIDNDTNGRATLISKIQDIGTSMIEESKLLACTVTENQNITADGDTAYFDIDVIDKDSMEHIYMTYKFQFSTNVE